MFCKKRSQESRDPRYCHTVTLDYLRVRFEIGIEIQKRGTNDRFGTTPRNESRLVVVVNKSLSVSIKETILELIITEVMTESATKEALDMAVEAMNDGVHFFDVTIICTTDDFQAEYWMERLKTRLPPTAKILAVSEDWENPSGAGNGLGTLYAFEKAHKLAATKYQMDLAKELASRTVSAALYHTAGKGTRLAPLPASENNNKPGVVSFF